MDDERWMRRALAVAERARGTVSPNPLVGCVLVADDQAVAEGWTQPPGGPHAEIEALRRAGSLARGTTAYVTLEPCNHTGRTGPCAQALIDAGVQRVVTATADPHPQAGGGAATLRAAGIAVEIGVCETAARDTNRVFFHNVATGRPYVIVKQAISTDGRIAAADGTSQWLTGPATRELVHRLRADADAVLVGSGTVLADDPRLTVRLDGATGPPPLRVVLDGRARTQATAQVFDGQAPTMLITADPGAAADHTARGVTVAAADPHDWDAVLALLWDHGVRSVLAEGGAAITGSLLRGERIDELHLHVAPMVLGAQGRPWVTGDGITTLAEAPRLSLASHHVSGHDVLLRYAIQQRTEA